MKILSNITAAKCEEQPDAVVRAAGSAHHEIAPGIFVHAAVTADGVVYHRGKLGCQVKIPFAALDLMILEHAPEILAKPGPPTGKAETLK